MQARYSKVTYLRYDDNDEALRNAERVDRSRACALARRALSALLFALRHGRSDDDL